MLSCMMVSPLSAQENYPSEGKVMKKMEALSTLGFESITSRKYSEVMNGQSFEYLEEYKKYKWFLHEGSLELNQEQLLLLGGGSYIITGDLKVHGVLNFSDPASLFVLGDVTAKNILLADDANCYFSGNTHFGDVLIITGGSGGVIDIKSPEGLYVYNDSDSANLKVSPEKVKVYQDEVDFFNSFGDPSDFFGDEFLEERDDFDVIGVDIYSIFEALKTGKKYLK